MTVMKNKKIHLNGITYKKYDYNIRNYYVGLLV